ncbi:MAG: hypothetical protein KF819_28990 [Labilithrix sp.]|nr:hypothetical protein [Labilithrix sp.]
MAPLLMHSEMVPVAARDSLRAAFEAPPERRDQMLHSAARILHAQTGLDCADVRELVGLTSSACT